MNRYIIYERDINHTHISMACGNDLREALLNYLTEVHEVRTDQSGMIDWFGTLYKHPLEYIEANLKFNPHLDEIQVQSPSGVILNPNTFEIRYLRGADLDTPASSVFTSADAFSLSGRYNKCRTIFSSIYPDSHASAFFWFLKDGILISFAEPNTDNNMPPYTVLVRYLCLWNNKAFSNTSVPNRVMVENWEGSFNDLEEQMLLGRPG
jgi:phage tail protein X